eukprot:CAMPEP_0178717858 /NCGR_PEP_ID=MMETSP0699-20121125/22176_1 /TAXON_ID=265572 /ORGANISM="Extubocellulus spinifer, Strain CCMP396" /LENGTH=65 /DNA_ID=CAMNT_0020367777 /DNA_START=966 /DNA_END=1163 /DNA_ORIENTATION=+
MRGNRLVSSSDDAATTNSVDRGLEWASGDESHTPMGGYQGAPAAMSGQRHGVPQRPPLGCRGDDV